MCGYNFFKFIYCLLLSLSVFLLFFSLSQTDRTPNTKHSAHAYTYCEERDVGMLW